MSDPVLFDTNVVIDYLRGKADAKAFLSRLPSEPLISVLTIAELYQGVRDGKERAELAAFVTNARVVVLDEAMAVAGGLWARTFRKSHGVGLADALIAATAHQLGITLVTMNVKHFPMLTDVLVPY